MKLSTYFLSALLMVFVIGCSENNPSDEHEEHSHEHHHESEEISPVDSLLLETLLRDKLALADSVEIVMSKVSIPPNTTLPLHWHPGEEFIYVLSGSGELILEGEVTKLAEGDHAKVGLRQVHTFRTLEESTVAVVFRVHKEGEPERVLVEE